MGRPPRVHEFAPGHTSGQLVAPSRDLGPGKHKRIAQILISGVIILCVGLFMISGYTKAKRPALMADCIGRLKILGQAIEMYQSDHDMRPPPGASWRYALNPYIDMVGGVSDEQDMQPRRRLNRPLRGFSSPMRCIANTSTNAISYFYLDRAAMRGRADVKLLDSLPVFVDESHHGTRAIILRDNLSAGPVEIEGWVRERQEVLRIARRRDWQDTYAYYALPPRQTQP